MDDYDICAACPYRGRSVLRVSKGTGAAGLPDCNRPRICPRAARRDRLHKCERLAQAEWKLVITLTMPPELRLVTAQNIEMQSTAWGKLLRTLKRRHGSFHYAWVREQTAGGNLHLHVLADCKVKETELAEPAAIAGFGLIHLKRTSETKGRSRGAIAYVTKSLQYTASHADFNWPLKAHLFGTSLPKLPAKRKGRSKENYTWIPNLDENGDPLLA